MVSDILIKHSKIPGRQLTSMTSISFDLFLLCMHTYITRSLLSIEIELLYVTSDNNGNIQLVDLISLILLFTFILLGNCQCCDDSSKTISACAKLSKDLENALLGDEGNLFRMRKAISTHQRHHQSY